MTPPGTWHIEDLAAAIGRPVSWIYKNRAKLERAGFPTPLPRLEANERLRWPEDECKAWIGARRAGLMVPANDHTDQTADDDARTRMARRLSAL